VICSEISVVVVYSFNLSVQLKLCYKHCKVIVDYIFTFCVDLLLKTCHISRTKVMT